MRISSIIAPIALSIFLVGGSLAEEAPPEAWVSEGSKAPDWTLQGSDGKTHSLSEALQDGPVVLAWFPRAFTRGCTIECKSLAENGDMIRAFKASYFMASVDAIEENTGFAAEHSADFPILSDESMDVARRYGVLADAGYAKRETFYIGEDGTILAVDRQVTPSTAAQDIAAMLEKIGAERLWGL